MELLKRIKNRKGQGATEYLLILAAVLVVAASAVYFLMGTGPGFMITPEANSPEASDQTVTFTVDSVTPDNITADLQVLNNSGAGIGSKNDVSITDGTAVTIDCGQDVPPGSKLKLTAEGSTRTFNIETD